MKIRYVLWLHYFLPMNNLKKILFNHNFVLLLIKVVSDRKPLLTPNQQKSSRKIILYYIICFVDSNRFFIISNFVYAYINLQEQRPRWGEQTDRETFKRRNRSMEYFIFHVVLLSDNFLKEKNKLFQLTNCLFRNSNILFIWGMMRARHIESFLYFLM